MRAGKGENRRNERGLCYIKGCERKMIDELIEYHPFGFKVKFCKQCGTEAKSREDYR